MANQVGSSAHSGVTILTEGIPEVIKKLRAAGNDLQDMKDLNHQLGLIVIAHAKVPADSGELAGTLRAGRGATKAVVRAGYAKRGAYAGRVHYGDPHTGNRANPFLTDALSRSQGQIVQALTNGMDDILRKNNLN